MAASYVRKLPTTGYWISSVTYRFGSPKIEPDDAWTARSTERIAAVEALWYKDLRAGSAWFRCRGS